MPVISDGSNEQSLSFFFDLNTSSWYRGPVLTEAKKEHTCSLVTQPDGTRDIVVVGGFRSTTSSNRCYNQRSVDIINLGTNTKQRGNQIVMHSNLKNHTSIFIPLPFCSRKRPTCWSPRTHRTKLRS